MALLEVAVICSKNTPVKVISTQTSEFAVCVSAQVVFFVPEVL